MNNTVSVIIPVYKVEAYLAQCVRSVLDQTYRDLEVILVDDGSPDNCPAMCDAFAQADSRVKVIHKENGGAAAARNDGLSEASGEYLVFLDSDDWMDTETIAKAVDMAEREQLDVVLWSYISERENFSSDRCLLGDAPIIWHGDDTEWIRRRIIGPYGESLSNPQYVFSFDTIWGKLYRRSVTTGVTFVDLKKVGSEEDALFNMEVFPRVKAAGYLPDVRNHYRKLDSSLTARYNGRLFEQWQTLYGMMDSLLTAQNADAESRDAFGNRVAVSILGFGLNEMAAPCGFFAKAGHIRRALKTEPWKNAVKKLTLSYFPFKWKVFYLLCKWRWTEVMTLMLLLISRLRSGKAK